MLSKIEELEIRVGELVKENHELREAGERLAKENIDKHFAMKKHSNEDKDEMRPELRETKFERVQYIAKDGFGKTALSTRSVFYRNWFRVI